MVMNDLLICNQFSCIQESDIVIYGTGFWGIQIYQILKKLNVNILGVCNTKKLNSVFNHYPDLSNQDIID